MDIQPAAVPTISSTCEYCKKIVSEEDIYCQECGFPVKGTAEEKQDFHYKIGFKQIQLQDTSNGIRKGRNSLFVVAGVFTIFSLIIYFSSDRSAESLPIVITNLVLAAVFLLLGFWSVQKPVAALISGLSLYVAVQLLNGIVDGTSFFKGIIFKVFIVIYLIRALQSAFEAQKISKELKVK
jgi:hypothetical protein